jgi:hypothetical protein
MDSEQVFRSTEPAAPLNAVARLLQLTDEIGRLIGASARSSDFGWMIDDAAELMAIISSLEATSSHPRSMLSAGHSLI